MKKFLLLSFTVIFLFQGSFAQCGAGYTNCSLNWDYLQFYPSAGISTYATLANSQTQKFSFGTQILTLTHNFTGANALGEDGTNTAETGSFGTGNDVHFMGDGTVTASFLAAVDNVKFSIYDIDYNQKVTITSNAGTVVALTKIGGTSILTLAGSGTASASATAAATTAVANTSTDGTLNVNITGPVTGFSIVVTQTGTKNGKEDGDFWLSDISACSSGTFTSNYYNVSKPYTNQGGYVLVSCYNKCYFVDPATGKGKLLFTDAGAANINSLAYDPVKHYVYYTWDATGAGGATNPANKTMRRYDYDMDTMGVFLNDVTTFFPTFDAGVETGAAAFYDTSLYLGVDINSLSGAKCAVWKVDINQTTRLASKASQFFAIDQSINDWGDFALTKDSLYNFNGQGGSESYNHVSVYSKGVTSYSPGASDLPKQTAVDWTGTLYSIGDGSGSPANGMVVPFVNTNGTLNTSLKKTITVNGTTITGQWRDGAEAFKPRVDFGDAPATYDPSASDPAMHEISPLLYLGSNSSNEWSTRGQTVLANSDNYDDGLNIQSLVNPSAGSFYCSVKYFNNTGNTATLCAWVDFNNNGVFDPGEGQTLTNLASNSSAQSVFIYWNGVASSLAPGQYTYIRVRITSSANGMTTANPTGFFDDGEVEDYRLLVTSNPLQTNLLSFDATNESGKAHTSWQVADEDASTVYTVQRSTDASAWNDVNTQKATAAAGQKTYRFTDPLPLKGTVYYRLQMNTAGSIAYGEIRKLTQTTATSFSLWPNPASSVVSVMINTEKAGVVNLQILNAAGTNILSENLSVTAGANKHSLSLSSLPEGIYWIRFQDGATILTKKLIVEK